MAPKQTLTQEEEQFLYKIEQIVLSQEASRSTTPASDEPHPSGRELYEYAAAALDRESRAKVRQHLMRCAACNAKTLLIMRLTSEEREEARDVIDDLKHFITDWAEKMTSSLGAVTWATSLWQPQWAGMPVSAADIPEQQHTFSGKEGEIEISCAWRDRYETTPAYIQISWLANLTVDRKLWALFFDPDTKKCLAEIPLGKYLEGGKSITSQTLGFNPSTQKWAVAILLKEEDA